MSDPPPAGSPPPPGPGAVAVELVPSTPRRYDLDALRGVAMLLGIVLHAAIPFVPYWEEGDTGGAFLYGLFEYIHLWRMPLFFLLSGFFTAMLWRRRGLRALMTHRAKRIALPLFVLYIPVIILVILGFVVGYVLADVDEDAESRDTAAYGDPNAVDEAEEDRFEDDDEAFSWAHMWFLWHLMWLVVVFGALAAVIERVEARAGRGPPEQLTAAAMWALPVLSLFPFFSMIEDVLGPDTSEGIVPAGHVIAFYAAFFFFGALAFRSGDRPAPIDRVGRLWGPQLATSLVLFVLLDGGNIPDEWTDHTEVLLAWMVSFGAIGLFRRHFAEPSYEVRWLSDAAYWMYLIHLPIVVALQGVAAALGLPAIPGFVLIVVVTVALLVPSYRYLVRYTPLGRLLNGSRTRDGDQRLRASIDVVSRSGS